MSEYHIANLVYSELKASPPDPRVQGFVDNLAPLFKLAGETDGLVAQVWDQVGPQLHLPEDQRDWGPWGPFVAPYFYDGPRGAENRCAMNLSVWKDLQSLRSFVYGEAHRNVLVRRREWIEQRGFPAYAIWWVPAGSIPSYEEASRRIEYLHEHGPTPVSFTFRESFAAPGAPVPASPT